MDDKENGMEDKKNESENTATISQVINVNSNSFSGSTFIKDHCCSTAESKEDNTVAIPDVCDSSLHLPKTTTTTHYVQSGDSSEMIAVTCSEDSADTVNDGSLRVDSEQKTSQPGIRVFCQEQAKEVYKLLSSPSVSPVSSQGLTINSENAESTTDSLITDVGTADVLTQEQLSTMSSSNSPDPGSLRIEKNSLDMDEMEQGSGYEDSVYPVVVVENVSGLSQDTENCMFSDKVKPASEDLSESTSVKSLSEKKQFQSVNTHMCSLVDETTLEGLKHTVLKNFLCEKIKEGAKLSETYVVTLANGILKKSGSVKEVGRDWVQDFTKVHKEVKVHSDNSSCSTQYRGSVDEFLEYSEEDNNLNFDGLSSRGLQEEDLLDFIVLKGNSGTFFNFNYILSFANLLLKNLYREKQATPEWADEYVVKYPLVKALLREDGRSVAEYSDVKEYLNFIQRRIQNSKETEPVSVSINGPVKEPTVDDTTRAGLLHNVLSLFIVSESLNGAKMSTKVLIDLANRILSEKGSDLEVGSAWVKEFLTVQPILSSYIADCMFELNIWNVHQLYEKFVTYSDNFVVKVKQKIIASTGIPKIELCNFLIHLGSSNCSFTVNYITRLANLITDASGGTSVKRIGYSWSKKLLAEFPYLLTFVKEIGMQFAYYKDVQRYFDFVCKRHSSMTDLRLNLLTKKSTEDKSKNNLLTRLIPCCKPSVVHPGVSSGVDKICSTQFSPTVNIVKSQLPTDLHLTGSTHSLKSGEKELKQTVVVSKHVKSSSIIVAGSKTVGEDAVQVAQCSKDIVPEANKPRLSSGELLSVSVHSQPATQEKHAYTPKPPASVSKSPACVNPVSSSQTIKQVNKNHLQKIKILINTTTKSSTSVSEKSTAIQTQKRSESNCIRSLLGGRPKASEGVVQTSKTSSVEPISFHGFPSSLSFSSNLATPTVPQGTTLIPLKDFPFKNVETVPVSQSQLASNTLPQAPQVYGTAPVVTMCQPATFTMIKVPVSSLVPVLPGTPSISPVSSVGKSTIPTTRILSFPTAVQSNSPKTIVQLPSPAVVQPRTMVQLPSKSKQNTATPTFVQLPLQNSVPLTVLQQPFPTQCLPGGGPKSQVLPKGMTFSQVVTKAPGPTLKFHGPTMNTSVSKEVLKPTEAFTNKLTTALNPVSSQTYTTNQSPSVCPLKTIRLTSDTTLPQRPLKSVTPGANPFHGHGQKFNTFVSKEQSKSSEVVTIKLHVTKTRDTVPIQAYIANQPSSVCPPKTVPVTSDTTLPQRPLKSVMSVSSPLPTPSTTLKQSCSIRPVSPAKPSPVPVSVAQTSDNLYPVAVFKNNTCTKPASSEQSGLVATKSLLDLAKQIIAESSLPSDVEAVEPLRVLSDKHADTQVPVSDQPHSPLMHDDQNNTSEDVLGLQLQHKEIKTETELGDLSQPEKLCHNIQEVNIGEIILEEQSRSNIDRNTDYPLMSPVKEELNPDVEDETEIDPTSENNSCEQSWSLKTEIDSNTDSCSDIDDSFTKPDIPERTYSRPSILKPRRKVGAKYENTQISSSMFHTTEFDTDTHNVCEPFQEICGDGPASYRSKFQSVLSSAVNKAAAICRKRAAALTDPTTSSSALAHPAQTENKSVKKPAIPTKRRRKDSSCFIGGVIYVNRAEILAQKSTIKNTRTLRKEEWKKQMDAAVRCVRVGASLKCVAKAFGFSEASVRASTRNAIKQNRRLFPPKEKKTKKRKTKMNPDKADLGVVAEMTLDSSSAPPTHMKETSRLKCTLFHLHPQEEEALVKFCKWFAGRGMELSECIINQLGHEIALRRKTSDETFDLLNSDWCRLFIAEHPDLVITTLQSEDATTEISPEIKRTFVTFLKTAQAKLKLRLNIGSKAPA